MTIEPPVRIENRTQLTYLLSEAAELEHGISCCYLFAGFSFKKASSEGLTAAQLDAVQRWKKTIMEVAVQEMLHLALVNNLLTAIGGAPHIRRPNLPTNPSMYPHSFELDLKPFNEQTLAGFIFLERPEPLANLDPSGHVTSSTELRPVRARDIFFDRPEYETVGHLYRGIQDGFRYLAEKYGEDRLFVGPPGGRAATQFQMPEIVAVTNLASALQAIETIVEQGEGASGSVATGHYARFVGIQEEYEALKKSDPQFAPSRPVLANPYTHRPGDLSETKKINVIDDPVSVATCNLFDGAYELLIQMLGSFFARSDESEEEAKLFADISVTLMVRVLSPLGDLITSMPAGPSNPGFRAGPNFYVPRNIHTPPIRRAAWISWRERLLELSAYCALLEGLPGAPDGLSRVGTTLSRFATRITDKMLGK